MSFFKNYYQKPGTGIKKDGPQKTSFAVCFELLWDNLARLIKINLVYLLFLLLPILLCAAMFLIFNYNGVPSIIWPLMFWPLILTGPANTAFAAMTRDVGRGVYSYPFDDFKKFYKKNFLKSIGVSAIQFAVFYFATVALFFYKSGTPMFILTVIFTVIFAVMQFYINLMVPSLNLSIGKMFKNAFIMTLMRLGSTILTLGIIAVFLLFTYVLANYSFIYPIFAFLSVAVLLTFYFVLPAYFINFISFKGIMKYIVEPFYAEDETKEKEENNKSQPEPEYIFENGKLIKRDIAEKETIFED